MRRETCLERSIIARSKIIYWAVQWLTLTSNRDNFRKTSVVQCSNECIIERPNGVNTVNVNSEFVIGDKRANKSINTRNYELFQITNLCGTSVTSSNPCCSWKLTDDIFQRKIIFVLRLSTLQEKIVASWYNFQKTLIKLQNQGIFEQFCNNFTNDHSKFWNVE